MFGLVLDSVAFDWYIAGNYWNQYGCNLNIHYHYMQEASDSPHLLQNVLNLHPLSHYCYHNYMNAIGPEPVAGDSEAYDSNYYNSDLELVQNDAGLSVGRYNYLL